MTLRQQAFGWTAAAILSGLALYALSGVLLPFLAALAIGYLLDPVVSRLERFGMGRTWATLLVMLVCGLIAVLVIAIIAPLLVRQLGAFIQAFPGFAARAQQVLTQNGREWLDAISSGLASRFGIDSTDAAADLQKAAGDLLGKGAQWLLSLFSSILSGGAALLSLISIIVVTPVVAFYLLLDWDKMTAAIQNNIPPRDRARLGVIAKEIDEAMAGFLRGQSLVALFLGAWYAIGLTVIGVNYGFLIGVIGGLTSIIPYVGSFLVLVLSMTVALAQGWPDWTLPLLAAAVVGSGQFLEGNILSPRLVGDSVGLHPVWLMFALLAFGALFGFVGLLVAVPVAAAMAVVIRHALEGYRASAFFLTGAPDDEGA